VAGDGDLALTLGAGNVYQAGEMLLEKLRGKG
jgi:UDP-N-acetylmuramate-alanine ligase